MLNGRKMILVALLVVGLAALPLLARSAAAAPIVTAARPQSPAIAQSLADGSFLAVWSEDRGMGTGLDLYAARLNGAGITVGTEIPILVAPGNQSDPALAFSRNNNAYLLIYTTDAATMPGVPTPGVPTPPVPPTPPGLPTVPAPPAAFKVETEFDLTEPGMIGPGLVVEAVQDPIPWLGAWTNEGAMAFQPPPPPPITPSAPPPPPGATATLPPLPTPGGTGVPPGPTAPPPPGPTSPPGPTAPPGPSPTPDPNAPPAPPGTSGARDLHGTWISTGGVRLTQTFSVVSSPADDTFPDLGYLTRNGRDEFALVWREVTGTDAAIAVMRLDGLGYFFVPSSKATVLAGGDLGRPSVAGEHTAGHYFVVWSQTPSDRPGRNVYGRKLNANAYPIGPVRNVAADAADQTYPSIASLGSQGGFLTVWEERLPGKAPDIRSRRLNQNGIPMRAIYDMAGGAPFSFAPDIASTEYPSTLVLWVDRNAASDNSIIANEVSRDGRRVGPERLVVAGGSGPAAVTPGVPPVFPTPPGPPIPPPPPTTVPLPTP